MHLVGEEDTSSLGLYVTPCLRARCWGTYPETVNIAFSSYVVLCTTRCLKEHRLKEHQMLLYFN